MNTLMYWYLQSDKATTRQYEWQRRILWSLTGAVDTWSQFCWVVPTHFKDKWAIRPAMKEILEKMGKPKVVYSDPDSGFLSQPLRNYFKDSDVDHIVSRLHARVAERTINGLL